MVTELGLIYSTGRHWTGSMIELGYGHKDPNFDSGRKWITSVDKSILSYLPDLGEDGRGRRREVITSGLILEQFLETTSCRNGSCRDATDGSANGGVLSSSIARYLLEIIKEKAGFRHSLTSLLPTEMQESTQCFMGCEFRHRKIRCSSCEPQMKGTKGNSILSSFLFERLTRSRKHKTQCGISPQRKRLSLSDSEICYVKESPESTTKEPTKDEENELNEIAHSEIIAGSDTNSDLVDETTKTPIFEAGEENEKNEEKIVEANISESPIPQIAEIVPNESSKVEVQKVRKKTVRFADDVGDALYQERLIPDTCLPPVLHFDRQFSIDDDFGDLGELDESLPGVASPIFKPMGPKRNSFPDIVKIPPPVPQLHHSNSSSGTLSLNVQKSPPSLTSPNNGTANWRLTFAQPAAQYLAFRQRLESNYVSLENVSMSNRKDNSDNLYLYGTIKVKNITFEKCVILRVTVDRWASHKDYPAVHNAQLSSSSSVSPYDTFMFNFNIEVEKMPQPRELQFAVCFKAGPNGSSGEYWDNNDGCNYVVVEEVALLSSPPTGKEEFFHNHPSMGVINNPMRTAVGGTEHGSFYSSPPVTAYTQDYRPNFNAFSSLTCYSSWQHYSSESMYY